MDFNKEKVQNLLGKDQALEGDEELIAKAAWLRAYSRRKASQAQILVILVSAFTLIGVLAKSDNSALGLIAIAAVVLLGGYLACSALLSRGAEKLEAAAAVLECRASKLYPPVGTSK